MAENVLYQTLPCALGEFALPACRHRRWLDVGAAMTLGRLQVRLECDRDSVHGEFSLVLVLTHPTLPSPIRSPLKALLLSERSRAIPLCIALDVQHRPRRVLWWLLADAEADIPEVCNA